MSKRLRTVVRNPSTAAGIPGITVAMKRHSDGTTITTDDTDANGLAEMTLDSVMYPGPAYLEYTSGSVYRRSGYVGGQIGGLIWSDTLNDFMSAHGIGVCNDIGENLQAFSLGTNMNVTVASGMAILKDGIPYVQESNQTVTIDTADGTNPRIDRIVVRLVREGQAQEGKITLEKITGSPSASPTVPGITQSSSTWDLSLCQVRVNAGVTSIAADKVTDERYSASLGQAYAFRFPLSIAPGDIFYIDASGRLTRLPKGTSGQVLTMGATIPAWSTGVSTGGLTVNFGNGVDVIGASEPPVYVELPVDVTLDRWMVQGDVSGSIQFNVAKATAGSSTYSNIHGTNPPKVTSALTASSTDFTSWTAGVSGLQKLKISISGTPTSMKRAALALRFTRN